MDDSRIRPLLLRFLEASDARAMEQFVAATRPRLIKAARRIGSPQDADDSVQAAYHALLQRGERIPHGPLFPWLLVATIRIAYRRKAVQRRARDLGDRLAVPTAEPGPLASAARLEEARLVRDAITKLPARYRDVIVLHYLEGLSAAEAARLLDISRSTVTTRLLRARRLLRSRLPQLTYALLLLPWLAGDGWAAVAPASTGVLINGGAIAMAWKAKTLVALGILAVGGAGVAVGHSSAASDVVPRARRPALDAHVAELYDELDDLRRINRSLQARLAEPGPAGPNTAPTKRAQPPEQSPPDQNPPDQDPPETEPPAVPDAIREAGAQLGAGHELVEQAWHYHNAPTREDQQHRLEALQRGGAQGYLAYVALLYGGVSGTHMDATFAQLWRPEFAGVEQALIEFIREKKRFGYAKWTAYRALGSADSAQSRDFLVRAAASEDDAGYYLSLAASLGQLGEARAFDQLARRISNKEWHRNVRQPIMAALVKIDRTRAKQVFLAHLRANDTDLLASVIALLGGIDRSLAKTEARALLEGPRAALLSGATLRDIKRLSRE